MPEDDLLVQQFRIEVGPFEEKAAGNPHKNFLTHPSPELSGWSYVF
jgi:hypothetical protein